MAREKWRKHHEWTGLGVFIFLLLFCLSGIALNHRQELRDVDVSRGWLPSRYRYDHWNNGLLRGTLPVGNDVIIYGSGGVFLCDKDGGNVRDLNDGLPAGADARAIRAVVRTTDGFFAVSQYALYRLVDGRRWRQEPFATADDERISDITCRGDTLVIVGRSYLYLAAPEATADTVAAGNRQWSWQQIQLPVPDDGKPQSTLFRIVWRLHSGELFGTAGRLVVDVIALILVFLAITGIVILLRPYNSTSAPDSGIRTVYPQHPLYRLSALWHNKIGRATIILTLLVVVSGWCLRPPLMIALVKNKTSLSVGSNPWDDKLRMLRYDAWHGDWLLSTSDGFYAVSSLNSDDAPISLKKVDNAPSVSVMGLNVWQQLDDGEWLCCSFSGPTIWDRAARSVAPRQRPAIFNNDAISGYSEDIGEHVFMVSYTRGTLAIAQPEALRRLPMSLWNVALEVHSGRLFFGPMATWVYAFVIGLLAFWCLWSGWRLSGYGRKKRRHNSNR